MDKRLRYSRSVLVILPLILLGTQVSSICFNNPSQSPSSSLSPNCDPYSSFSSRGGDPRFPYGSSSQSFPPSSYNYYSTGYGSGYSYDHRRMGNQNPSSDSYNSRYPPPSSYYPPSSSYYPSSSSYTPYYRSQYGSQYNPQPPYSYSSYGRVTPFDQALRGSQGYLDYPYSPSPWASQHRPYYPQTSYPYSPYYPTPRNPYNQYPPAPDPFGQYPLPSVMKQARAVMKGHPATSIAGSIEFCQMGKGSVQVKGRITGLPGGQTNKGLHILKGETCPPLDQFPIDSKALEHYNPFFKTHGHRDSPNKHVGDLGNIFVQYDGVSVIDFTADAITLDDPKYTIANHSIVITDKEDDYGSNPNDPESRRVGNSGKAIACGIILPPQSNAPSIQPGNQMGSWDPFPDPIFKRDNPFYASMPPNMNYQFPSGK